MARTSRSTVSFDLMPDLGDVTMDQRIEILFAQYRRHEIDWKAMGLNLLRCFEIEPEHPRGPEVVGRVIADYRREIGDTHVMTLEARGVLADVLAARGDDRAAERLLREALGHTEPAWEVTERLRDRLFVFLARRNRLDEALRLHAEQDGDRWRLAQLLDLSGHPERAVTEYRGALAEAEADLGADHQTTMNIRTMLAMLATRIRHPIAEEAQRGVVADLERNQGPDSPSVLVAASNLAQLVRDLGRLDEAAELFARTVDDHRRVLGPDHPGTIITAANHANLLFDLDRDREAERVWAELLPLATRVLGPDHPVTRAAGRVREPRAQQPGEPPRPDETQPSKS